MSNLTISTKGIALIKEFEGCYLKAYRCPAGMLTIGYGHTGGVKEGQVITKAKAESLLKQDLATFVKAVNRLPYKLNQNQFDTLVSFSFNCGTGNLNKLTQGNTRSLEQIADALLLYNKANGKVLAGLTRRRQAERLLFNTKVPVVKKTTETKYNATVKSLQVALNKSYGYNLAEDGLLGKNTIAAMKKYSICSYKANAYAKWIQTRLRAKGYNITVDGKYGQGTAAVVKAFQKRCALKQDGIVGYNTACKLI